MSKDTLAHRLGTTAHISPLLMKAQRLGLRVPEDLERLAVQRGCEYYNVTPKDNVLREESRIAVSRSDFSNAELAVALLSPSLPALLLRQRMGAAMLSAPDVEAEDLVALALQEGCGDIACYIARCGSEVEPSNPFWVLLQTGLAGCEFDEHQMPHPTRFIEMTGVNRGKIGIQKHWVRPIATLALAG